MLIENNKISMQTKIKFTVSAILSFSTLFFLTFSFLLDISFYISFIFLFSLIINEKNFFIFIFKKDNLLMFVSSIIFKIVENTAILLGILIGYAKKH